MKVDNQAKQLCLKYFAFLEKIYNFSLITKMTEPNAATIYYKSDAVGIILKIDPLEFYLFVTLCRLVDGSFPSKTGEITPSTVINCFDLDDIVVLRSINSLIPEYTTNNKNLSISLEEIIIRQAKNLRNYADDILRADFSIFTELDKIVKKRARQFAIKKWGERATEFGWSVTEETDTG